MKESQASQSIGIDALLEADVLVAPCPMARNENEVGSCLDEFTMADGISVVTPKHRLGRCGRTGTVIDPDMQPPKYMLSKTARCSARRGVDALLSSNAKTANNDESDRVLQAKQPPSNEHGKESDTSSDDLFNFTALDWSNQESFSLVSEHDTGHLLSGPTEEVSSVGNPWEDDSVFGAESISIPPYLPLDDESDILSSFPRPAQALSTMTSCRDLAANATINEAMPSSPTGGKLTTSRKVKMSPVFKESPRQRGTEKRGSQSSPSSSKTASTTPRKKKVIRLSTKDFAALGFGDESCVKLVVKEHKFHRSLGSLIEEQEVVSTTATQPTLSSQEETSSDNKPLSRHSNRRRSSLGMAADREKGRTSPVRRRMSNDAGKERSTRSRTVRRRSLDLDVNRDGRERNMALQKRDTEGSGRRRSVSPRRMVENSTRPGRSINLSSERETKPRSKSQMRNIDDATSSRSGSQSKSRSRRSTNETKDRTAAETSTVLPSRLLARTVSSRIRDIGITPEQVLLLQKCGLSITHTQ